MQGTWTLGSGLHMVKQILDQILATLNIVQSFYIIDISVMIKCYDKDQLFWHVFGNDQFWSGNVLLL